MKKQLHFLIILFLMLMSLTINSNLACASEPGPSVVPGATESERDLEVERNLTPELSTESSPNTESAQNFIPILMYHHFDVDPANSGSTIMTPETFRSQLSHLKSLGYETITTEDLYLFLTTGSELPRKPLLITIDDGYLSTYTYAYPILKELGMKATSFAIVAFREKANLMYSHYNWDQAREMADSGVIDIQSHGYSTHYQWMNSSGMWVPATTQLNSENQSQYEERLQEDFSTAKDILEEKLDRNVISMAFPYGYFDPTVKKIAEETGYDLLLTIQEGVVYPGEDLLEVPRINVSSNFTGADIEARIQKLAKQEKSSPVYLRVDGDMATGKVVLRDGVSYVPLKSLSEMQGLTVNWNEERQRIVVKNRDHRLIIYPKDFSVSLDGEIIDIPSFISNDNMYYQDTLYVAVRPFAESMGYQVGWTFRWFGDLNLIDVSKEEAS